MLLAEAHRIIFSQSASDTPEHVCAEDLEIAVQIETAADQLAKLPKTVDLSSLRECMKQIRLALFQ